MNWLPTAVIKYFYGTTKTAVVDNEIEKRVESGFSVLAFIGILIFISIGLKKWQS